MMMTRPHVLCARTVVCVLMIGACAGSAFGKTQSATIRISMAEPATAAPPPLEVGDAADVRLVIAKNLLQQCTIENKPAEIKAEANPLSLILGVATKLFGVSGALPSDVRDFEACDIDAETPPDGDADAERIEATLKDVFARLRAFRLSLVSYERGNAGSANAIGAEIGKLTRCVAERADGSGDEYVCHDVKVFAKARDRVLQSVRTFLEQTPVPGSEGLNAELDAVKKALVARIPGKLDPNWLPNALTRIDCYAGQMENLNDRRKRLVAAREQLLNFAAAATMFQPVNGDERELVVPLRGFRSSVAAVTVSCVNYFPKQATVSLDGKPDQKVDSLALSITFKSPARLAASGGLLYSAIGKLRYGSQPVKTGVDANGTDTFVLKIAETDRSSTQTVPFFFLHGRLFGVRPVYSYVTGGVGLNANSGGTQVEYFAGGTLGIKNVYFGVGAHFGRVQELAGNFKLDEVVPDRLVPPVTRPYRKRIAATVSYKLPLP